MKLDSLVKRKMMVLFYYNWNGTVEEMYKWEEEMKKDFDKNGPEGVKITGMYTPSIPWNRVWVYETDSIDKLFKTWSERPNKIRNTDLVIFT
jgi:hypothetical protein